MPKLLTITSLMALSVICFADPSLLPMSPITLVVPVQKLLPKPYEFGFEFGDGLGMSQHRREVADGMGTVKGSYGYVDPQGVNRIVDYTADNDGFKAVIRSNEPGTANQDTANVEYIIQFPPAVNAAQELNSILSNTLI